MGVQQATLGLVCIALVTLLVSHLSYTQFSQRRQLVLKTSTTVRNRFRTESATDGPPRQVASAPPGPATAIKERGSDSSPAASLSTLLGTAARTPPIVSGDELECKPSAQRGSRSLEMIVPADSKEWPVNCKGREELCDVVRKTAVGREVLIAVCNSAVRAQLQKWIEANRRAGISNMLIIAIDRKLPEWLDENGVAYWMQVDKAAGSHKISAQKFKYVRSFLSIGCSVIMSDIDVVYLQNPFLFLHKDADVEGTTDGWDDGSAYGWMEQLDDPSLGAFGRFRPAMRITAWNSGLWYARATNASLRLMSILAYRMEHEPNTWDQAAFGEEVTRPARDDHLAAGLVKRALSYWCFANSKTVFRRMRVEPKLKSHRPVVVHANYHQPKEPRMRAVYDRWHLDQLDALDRWSTEPVGVVPAPELEKDFLHMINDGFVSGGDTRNALAAVQSENCRPMKSKHGLHIELHTIPNSACPSKDVLCEAARRAAARGDGHRSNELLLVIGGEADAPVVRLLLRSAEKAEVSNVLLVATDDKLLRAVGDISDTVGIAMNLIDSKNPQQVWLLKWGILAQLLSQGFGVLTAHPATLLVSNPFKSLYHDADVEAMTMGWDDPSSYGYNHVIDDPSMGFTRYCHGSRIVGYEPNLFFANPTKEANALATRMQAKLKAELAPAATAWQVATKEREAFLHELWMPSHRGFASAGAIPRVLNYLCFVNSKVMFRQFRGDKYSGVRPVLVSLTYHSDVVPRLQALYKHFHEGDSSDFKSMSSADVSGDPSQPTAPASCGGLRSWKATDGDAPLAKHVINESPFAWGGVPGFEFAAAGQLKTPWGAGQWGVHEDTPDMLFADFAGSKHNLHLSHGVAVSTRCSDSNVVLLRSVKNANLPQS